MDSILSFLAQYQTQVLTIVGLIALDLLLGVASALKAGAFDGQKVALFYRTSVVPNLIGWLAFTAAGYFISPNLVGSDLIGVIAGNGGFALVVASLLSSIWKSAAELGVLPTPRPQ